MLLTGVAHGVAPARPQTEANESAAAAAKNCVMESIEYARSRGLVQSGDKVVSMYNVERQCAVIRVVRASIHVAVLLAPPPMLLRDRGEADATRGGVGYTPGGGGVSRERAK